MIAPKETEQPDRPPVALIDIGNATVAVGCWKGGVVHDRRSFRNAEIDAIGAAVKAIGAESKDGFLTGVGIASVVPETLDRLSAWIEKHLLLEPLVVGRQIPLPIDVKLDAPKAVGVDRICNAAAAYDRNKQACVIVDCGSAITIDVVDDEGAFIGGAILPGLAMQATALNQLTAQLPKVDPIEPEDVIGGDTTGAIRSGIYHGTAGAVRAVVEAYATHFNRWPTVVGTGGDVEFIAKPCDIFDAILPELCLRGVGLAYDKRMTQAVTL